MDLTKLYIIQSITAASNNLRLNTQKIEVVALLREFLIKSENLEEDIRRMKKVTELSKMAIRLSEIYSFLTSGKIDFFKISERFKEHSQYLIKELSYMLDIVNPPSFKQALEKIKEDLKPAAVPEEKPVQVKQPEKPAEEISADLHKRKSGAADFAQEFHADNDRQENERLKEQLILEDEKEDDDQLFQNFEASVLKPIKSVDNMLKQLTKNEVNYEELVEYAEIMKRNGEMSSKIGFEIIASMHKIISNALILIKNKSLMPGKEVIESIRACLIVIVAVVRGKEVDITNYLNRAEEFGKKILRGNL